MQNSHSFKEAKQKEEFKMALQEKDYIIQKESQEV
jgi:hypothetical protein